jgi:Ca2+-binding RTX toxin-like protein
MRARLLIAAVAVTGALAVAGPASASQISYDGQTLTYSAGPGESNRVLLGVADGDVNCGGAGATCLTVNDSGAHIAVGTSGCVLTYSSSYAGDAAACPLPQRVRADLGDGDDAYWDWDGPSTVDAGGGNDNPIFGEGGDDTIAGGPGNDVLYGDGGNDSLDGGPGDDDLEGIPGDALDSPHGAGSDRYTGGGGGDSVVYTNRTEDLSLSIDGVANDGAPGEGDNIGTDISAVYGGNGSDTITGSPHRDVLVGDTGNDTINGEDGDDALYGSNGSDRLDGAAGQDYLEGDDGDDTLDGGPDADTFYGESPLDFGSGRDRILARDGVAEQIDCGPGIDAAQFDATDISVYGACEAVDVAAVPFKLVGAAPGKQGALALDLSLPGPGKVRVDATAKPAKAGGRKIAVGSAGGTAQSSGAARLTLRLTGAARKALKRRGRLTVSLRARFTPAGGGATKVSRATVTLRAHR